MGRLILLVGLVVVFVTQPGWVHGQADKFDQFKSALDGGNHLGALELIASSADTTDKSGAYLASKVRSVADRALKRNSQDCAGDYLYVVHTKALLSYSTEANVVLRKQQELGAQVLALHAAMDHSCKARSQESILGQMNALPSYAGALGVTYMELFPQMDDEEVVSFLAGSKWVLPMIAQHERIIQRNSTVPIAQFIMESLAVVNAVTYAAWHDQQSFMEIPAPVEYVSITLDLADQAMRSATKEMRRYSSLLSIAHMILMSDEAVAKAVVTEANTAEHMALMVDIVGHWSVIDLPKPLREMIEQVTPIYYAAFLNVYFSPYKPDDARLAILRGAELIAKDHKVISSALGSCTLGYAAAMVRAQSLLYDFQVDECSEQLLDFFVRSDSISIACAADLGANSYSDTWTAFQNCFLYCTSLGEYQASVEMMAIAAETLTNERYASTRASWMDFMLESFDGSIRHDTIMNSRRSSRLMADFVRIYVTYKDGPFTNQQALFVLLHLAGIEDILAEPLEGRCTLIERVAKDAGTDGSAKGIAKLVKLLTAECRGQDDEVVLAARNFVDSDYGESFRPAQIFAYSILFDHRSYPKKRSEYYRYISLNEAQYGLCHPYMVGSVGKALSWYSENHSPAEVKQLLDDLFSRFYRPECQKLVSWLPAYMTVSNAVSYDLALKAILDANMLILFKGILPEDCQSFEETEAFVRWNNSSYSTFKEAEASARVSLVVLNAMHGGNEEAWFDVKTPYVKTQYRRLLMLSYTTLCSAFNSFGDVRADSLCRYASLMEELLIKEPALAVGFADHVQVRLAECQVARGASLPIFTALLSKAEVSAMDAQRFSSYAKWYGVRTQDTVTTISLRWPLTDREAVIRELRPINDYHAFMLNLARQKSALSAYSALLVQWASWTPSTVHKDYLLSVLESIYERYPELGVSYWNTLSQMHTSAARSIIIHNRYLKQVEFDYSYLDLIGLRNCVISSDLWLTLENEGRYTICKEVLEVLSKYDLKNSNDALAWQRMACMGSLFLIENGNDAQVQEMQRLMTIRMKTLQHLGQFAEGAIEVREYQMFIELLKARSKPKVMSLSVQRSLLELMKEAKFESAGVDPTNLLRGYAAVLGHNPSIVENPDIISELLQSLSFRFWYDFLYKDERFMSYHIQLNLHAFWTVVRASIMNRDTGRLPQEFTTTWVETLWLQSELFPRDRAASGFKEIGFDEELYRKLVATYWSYPDGKRDKSDEFLKITAIYDSLYANSKAEVDRDACLINASVERYWSMVTASEQQSISTLQTREALSRYVDMVCNSSRPSFQAELDEHADTWIRFPLRTAILEFNRDEGAGLYRLLIRTENAVEERVLGSIGPIEESWRKWATELETGDGHSDNAGVPFFWARVVQAIAADTSIKQYVLVPAGIYFNVNPAVLPLESTGQVRVDVVVDLDAYLRPQVPTNRVGSVVLVGGLDYGGKEGQRFALAERLRSDSGLDRGSGWVKLPGTEREVNAIAAKLQGKRIPVELITGGGATPERFSALAFPQAIHLATHGFVDQRQGEDRTAGLVLSDANASDGSQKSAASYLYAEDIRELDLFACDLVVLSACRTALSSDGHGQGEIIQAFKEAGVSKVVASSWAVPDECTSLLMEHFYDYYLAGVPASQALAEAQRKVAIRFPNKRDWAAFMVYH